MSATRNSTKIACLLALTLLAGCPDDKVDSSAFANGSGSDSSVTADTTGDNDGGTTPTDVSDAVTSPDTSEVKDTSSSPKDTFAGDAGKADTSPTDAGPPDTGPKTWPLALYAGGSATCFRKTDGTAVCWGRNAVGQTGTGAGATKLSKPMAIAGISQIARIGLAEQHGCAVHGSGKVSCWGDSFHGQIGNGVKHVEHLVPVATKVEGTAFEVSANVYSSAALSEKGVWGWGNNTGDKFQAGNYTSKPTPLLVKPPADASPALEVCVGDHHMCVLGKNKKVYCWGSNEWGELGHGTIVTSGAFVAAAEVKALPQVDHLACGSWHSCAWIQGGKAYCWGKNLNGQLGNGGIANIAAAVQVIGLDQVSLVAPSRQNSCAIANGGKVYCWGKNDVGQTTTKPTSKEVPTPTEVPLPTKMVSVAAGSYHGCAATTGGDVYCWGGNNHGQHGNGTTTDNPKPTKVLF
ncbi:MAG: hypothetical protein KC502_09975 [Myxococcales bacterium]|nr:hypothetical protein [Myxococcales bacterium]